MNHPDRGADFKSSGREAAKAGDRPQKGNPPKGTPRRGARLVGPLTAGGLSSVLMERYRLFRNGARRFLKVDILLLMMTG